MLSHIQRLELSVENDPELAIGSAKELIETVCKTILKERGEKHVDKLDINDLTKLTLKKLRLIPENIHDERKGGEIIKRILQNLGTLGKGIAELRNKYGTGHGREGRVSRAWC